MRLIKEDFINKSIKVIISNKEYNGYFKYQKEKLLLFVQYGDDIEAFENSEINIDIISGILLEDNTKVTLLNCMRKGSFSNNNSQLNVVYWIDRIIVGANIEESLNKCITSISATFDDIRYLLSYKPFVHSFENDTIELKDIIKEYDVNDKKYVMISKSHYSENNYELSINTEIYFDIYYPSLSDIDSAIHDIYSLRNLLSFLSKKYINILNIELSIGESKNLYIVECISDPKYNDMSEEVLEIINHRNQIKIDTLSDFESIIQKYENIGELLLPIEEIYIGNLKFKSSDVTRFINDITMLECYCMTFYKSKAKALAKKNGSVSKNIEFKYMVELLIMNINEAFNFDDNVIKTIAKNIKDARTKYIHYKNNKIKTYDLFSYYYFIEDIILLNIYKSIGLEIKNLEYISYVGLMYDVNDLTN